MEDQNNKNYQRPNWDEYFMQLVEIIGSRGTCDRGRAGCVITRDKRIVSTGYVGSPVGLSHCDEIGHEMHTVIHEDGKQSRHCIRTTHAEQNAICQAARFGVSLLGATLYCKMTPCYTCGKMIINTGITRVVCAQDYHGGQRSKEIFKEAGIQFDLLSEKMTTYADMGNHDQVSTNNSNLAMQSTSQTTYSSIKNNNNHMANIHIYDEFNPEDNAMLQALYSRSPQSVTEHVKKVKESGSGKFMEKFYVGYGHNSIADCGSTTIFIEQISILADKAIQDWPLYSGQETSTRYVDMSKQPIVDPINNTQSKEVLKNWMDFYIQNQEKVQEHIKINYPKKPDENDAVYDKAVKARTFDIMRGFLPAGITTQLSWHTNLRQAWDKLALLQYNPLTETQQIAKTIISQLKEKYPNSFCHKQYEEQEAYRRQSTEKYSFYDPDFDGQFCCQTSIDPEKLNNYLDLINSRPQKTNLPHFLTEFGLITFDFYLDFGSFRDLQRHRNGVCRMPLLSTKHGFNQWYLQQLPADLQPHAHQLITNQNQKIDSLNTSQENKQYLTAMGFNVPCRVTYGLPATVYVIELRSGKAVHPTLRKIAHQMHYALQEKFPNLKLHSDLQQDDWDVRRGLQDIIEK